MPQHSIAVMIFVCLLQLLVCPSLSQLALASSRYIQPPPAKRSSPYEYRDSHPRRLFTKLSDLKPLSRINSSGIESEIAAIFKGVAYGSGSSSTTPSTTTTKSTSTTPSTPFTSNPTKSVTESPIFIGKQKIVHLSVGSTSDDFLTSSHEIQKNIHPEFREEIPSKSHNTTYTYLIQSENAETYIKSESVMPKHDPTEYSHIQGSIKEPLDEIQVRVTSVLRNKALGAVTVQLGKAWLLHIYATGIVFAFLAVVCLLSLSRINACCQMLPRGYFITLHLMLFLASFFRSILFFHDPYGAYGRLPFVLTALLFNTVDPCLTTAFAVMLLVLLRGAKKHVFPFNVQSPLVLAIICGVHIGSSVVVDVSSGVIDNQDLVSTLNIATQSATAAWGCILCLGFVLSYSSIEKAAQKLNDDTARLTLKRGHVDESILHRMMAKPSLTYAARLFLICSLLHGLLIAFIILNLVTKNISESPSSSESWAWWTQNTLERIIEISLAVLLLGATLVLTQTKPRISKGKREEKIFSIFDNCRRNAKGSKSVGVYPVVNEKCNILANGTLSHSSPTNSLNFSTAGWKRDLSLKKPMTLNSIDSEFHKILQNDPKLEKSLMLNQQLTNDCILSYPNERDTYCNYYTGFNSWEKPLEFQQFPNKNHCLTLPVNKYYCSSQIGDSCERKNKLKSNTIISNKSPECNFERSQGNRLSNQCLYKQTSYSSASSKYDNDYDIASYYSNSNASTSSNIYSRPYSQFHCHNRQINEANLHPLSHTHNKMLQRGYDTDPKSEVSACSSYSEMQVDYLTDASSVDGLEGSLSRSQTLPISSQHIIRSNSAGTPIPQAVPVHSKDNGTPSPPIAPIDIIKSSTNTVNDAFKSQAAFFGKLVPSTNSQISYAPLSLDDSLSPSEAAVTASSTADLPVTEKDCAKVNSGHTNGDISEPITSL